MAPLVILAGWLGCTEKSLERYKKLYRSLGVNDVLVRIPSPTAIVMSALYPPNSLDRNNQFESMDNVAKEIVEELRYKTYTHVIIHVFSNGGCFLWEAISELLKNQQSSTSYATLKAKISGIVFDSAPADFSTKNSSALLYKAISYCNERDQLHLKTYLNDRISQNGVEEEMQLQQNRAKDFWGRMKCCDLDVNVNVPHLYIFSKDDKLTPYGSLMKLIEHRKVSFDRDQTHVLMFERSSHCRHLDLHPKDCTASISAFLLGCIKFDQDGSSTSNRKIANCDTIQSRL